MLRNKEPSTRSQSAPSMADISHLFFTSSTTRAHSQFGAPKMSREYRNHRYSPSREVTPDPYGVPHSYNDREPHAPPSAYHQRRSPTPPRQNRYDDHRLLDRRSRSPSRMAADREPPRQPRARNQERQWETGRDQAELAASGSMSCSDVAVLGLRASAANKCAWTWSCFQRSRIRRSRRGD